MATIKNLTCTKKMRTLTELTEELKEALCSEVVCEEKLLNEQGVWLCFEQYYFRCGGYVALSVILTESDERQDARIAGFDGSGLANISWGANQSFARKAVKVLAAFGFAECGGDEPDRTGSKNSRYFS